MSPEHDGGPAFARPATISHDGYVEHEHQTGMSLRDWFAGMALQGMLKWLDKTGGDWEGWRATAKCAYEVADRMLQARKATAPQTEKE